MSEQRNREDFVYDVSLWKSVHADMNNNIILPDKTRRMIQNLTKLVSSSHYSKTPVFDKKTSNNLFGSKFNWKNKNRNKFNSSSKSSLSHHKSQYKRNTEHGNYNEHEKILTKKTCVKPNDIDVFRSHLNKLTRSNYDTILNKLALIWKNIEEEKYDEYYDILLNCSLINSIHIELYVDIIIQFIADTNYAISFKRIDSVFRKNIEDMKTSKYVSADIDYDEFCNQTKERNKRSVFFKWLQIYLKKQKNKNVYDIGNSIINTCIHELESNMCLSDKYIVCDELIEWLFIFEKSIPDMKKCIKNKYYSLWNKIIEHTKNEDNTYKIQSVSKKSLFKCMDMEDNLKTIVFT